MTSEEIIQRLLDEKKISVKEAMVILKDLAKIGIKRVLPNKIIPDDWWKEPNKTTAPRPPYDTITVMYGVTTNPYTYNENNNGWNTTANSDVTFTTSDTIKNNNEDKNIKA